ncbi:MAG: hypothetical protein LBL07_00725 [Tannerella sp.]|nr:hypothetical protein [Tannerella sp.]
MKRNVLIVCMGVFSALFFFSCRDEVDNVYVSYGVIRNVTSKDSYEILTDKGNTLVVTRSYTSAAIEDGKRILANYEILSDRDKNKSIYEVKVNGFYYLLSKPPVSESFILADEEMRRDSIGNDPFNRVEASFGGDYINIKFNLYYSGNSDRKHMINLIYDDTRSTADTLYLTLRHNAYGEALGKTSSPLYRAWGMCSFKIADLLPEDAASMPVKLTWTQYDGNGYDAKEYYDTGTFNRGSKEEKQLARTGFDDTIEVE